MYLGQPISHIYLLIIILVKDGNYYLVFHYYRGRVLLIVNVPTRQTNYTRYASLLNISQNNYNNGVRVLAFLCNQFNAGHGVSTKIL